MAHGDAVAACRDEIDLDAVLPLVIEDGGVPDPVVLALLESGNRQGEGIEQRPPLRTEATLWDAVAREGLAGQRIVNGPAGAVTVIPFTVALVKAA